MRKKIAIFLAVSLSIALLLSVCAFAPEKAVAQTGSYDLTGKWNINANSYKGTFEITDQSGNTFSGTMLLEGGSFTKVTDGKITGDTITFTRHCSGGILQYYTGPLSVDANGNASITGAFTQSNVGRSYDWSATKATPISSPATPAPTALAQTGSYDLGGTWSIIANNSRGTFEITNQSGNTFSGTVHIDAGKTEKLTNGKISGNTFTFTRMWDSGSLRQDYTGTLSVDANGNAKISGTFTQNGASSYKWTATKATPISTPVTPAPTTPVPATPAPATPTTSAGSGAEAFESGSRIMWHPASGLGYRLFRSTSQSSLGISVTDFYITGTSFADVNVEPNTTYYYTVKPVLAEARPFEGIEEKLGPTIATFTVKTGSQVYKPGSFKHFILMKLGSPYMSVDGVSQEIDPGRGTQPLVISGRTMVPIRAVVEAMGGTVNWDAGTQKITLNARGNQVEMWLNKKDIKINGTATKMDVPPISQQGRTFVPLRFAAENLNCKVDWINSTKEAVTVYED